MLQMSLSFDRRAADCGGSDQSSDVARPGGLVGFLRTLLPFTGRDRMRVNALDPLSDHLLQDIGMSRADVQALSL